MIACLSATDSVVLWRRFERAGDSEAGGMFTEDGTQAFAVGVAPLMRAVGSSRAALLGKKASKGSAKGWKKGQKGVKRGYQNGTVRLHVLIAGGDGTQQLPRLPTDQNDGGG